jgi:transketolase
MLSGQAPWKAPCPQFAPLALTRRLDSYRFESRSMRSSVHGDAATAKGRAARSLTSADVRRSIIEQSKRAGVGHIGSALSITDILVALFSRVLDFDDDMFVLSKGHAALAQYCVLEQLGVISRKTLGTYCADDSHLGVHPEHALIGVAFSTGSLGHGPSLGAGVALAKRMAAKPGRVFVLLSDAELNEGSVWEALMFAGHHKLDNLCLVLDNNGQQALAPTAEVINLSGLATAVESLGWECQRVDGHDVEKLAHALEKQSLRAPHFVIADTISGKGVSFMEREVKWHYFPLDDEQYAQALSELG